MIKGQLKNRYVWKLTNDEWFEIGKKALKKGIYVIDEKDKTVSHTSIDNIGDRTLSYTYWGGGFSGGCPGDDDEWYTDYYERDEYGYTWALTEKELAYLNELGLKEAE